MTSELDLLKTTAETLLEARGVFDVDAYGRLNLEEVDQDFIGYVMWVEDPPYDHDFAAWQDNVPPRRAPTAQEQRLMELGADFFGLMKTARHFIGHGLMYQPFVNPLRVDPTEFDFSEFAALVSLTAASDRLRDFVITAVLGQKTKAEGELVASYAQLESADLAASVEELRIGFKAAQKGRKARNAASHGLATQPAHVQRHMIDADRTAFIAQTWEKPNRMTTSWEEMVADGARSDAASLAKVEARVQTLCQTYIALVKLGETSFRTEHNFRQRRGAGWPNGTP